MPRRSEFKMRWRNSGTLALVIILSISFSNAIETQNQHAPSSSTVIHHPTASLSIAGDLKDVKLKASIAQLVRALQHPSKPSEPERRPKLELDAKKPPTLITKHNINAHGKDGRKLFYGAEVPAEITISSQPLQITEGANKTGGKRSRSLSSVDSKGVKTIEGVRVPDDEHDKHYTWRNARVIKGFLVPNGRDPNPHKKRQVVITDPQAYLAAAAAAQAQGATAIIDGSTLQSQQNSRQGSQVVYSHSQNAQQPLVSQVSQAQAHNIVQQHDLGSSAVYHGTGHSQQSHLQQPVHQYQSATSGQTTAFAYAPQQQGQMYVLQDGNTYVQYNPVQVGQTQPVSQLSQSQTQFYSRSGESSSSSATAQTPQVQTVAVPPVATASDSQNQQDLQIQQHLAQAQAAVQAFQEQNAQAQLLQQYQQAQIQAQSALAPQEQVNKEQSAQQQTQAVHHEQTGASATVPQGAAVTQQAQQAQDILAAATAANGVQYIQIQGQPQTQQGSAGATTVYQFPAQNTFADRQAQIAYQNSQNAFVIQPQTYVAGPGGQAFTIPIPVPADQAHQTTQRRDDNHHYQQQQHHQYQQYHNQNQKQRTDLQQHHQQQHHQQQHHQNQNPHSKDKNNLANRVMQALHHNKKALDRMDTTTAVVPALASTGIFLGLSALAAGWYLSKGNREVGIVRRTGKPAGGSSQSGLSRSRRDVGVPPNNYPQEVDQATFFQSIIQQSLEKTQQQYDDQVEPVYNREVQQEPVYNREPEPERPSRPKPRHGRPSKPQNRDDVDDDYYSNSKVSKHNYAQDKSGAVTVASSKNFAKVFIPALIVGVSVVVITALIFGWYVTGANREIAFLEPASYSRKKRSLLSPQALSDGWLQRTITAIHGNPYDRMPIPTSKSLLPHPFLDRETSKTSDLEFKISNTGLTGVLAGGAIIAIVALGLANSLSEASNRQLKTGRANPSASFPINNNPNAHKHSRASRGIHSTNDLTEGHIDNPGFLATILSNIQLEPNTMMSKFQEAAKWQETPCAKRIFCDLMTTQDDDTIRVMEKRMATFINMLPESMSKTLSHTFSDVVSSIYKKDCSVFTCGGHRVDSSNVHQPSSPVNKNQNQPR